MVIHPAGQNCPEASAPNGCSALHYSCNHCCCHLWEDRNPLCAQRETTAVVTDVLIVTVSLPVCICLRLRLIGCLGGLDVSNDSHDLSVNLLKICFKHTWGCSEIFILGDKCTHTCRYASPAERRAHTTQDNHISWKILVKLSLQIFLTYKSASETDDKYVILIGFCDIFCYSIKDSKENSFYLVHVEVFCLFGHDLPVFFPPNSWERYEK